MPVELSKFQGRPPYAAELFGVYRPLIGWRGRLSGLRVARQQESLLESVVRRILPDVEVGIEPAAANDVATDSGGTGSSGSVSTAFIFDGGDTSGLTQATGTGLQIALKHIGIGRVEPSVDGPMPFAGIRLLDEVRKAAGMTGSHPLTFDPSTGEMERVPDQPLPTDDQWRRLLTKDFLDQALNRVAEAVIRDVRRMHGDQVAAWAPVGPHEGDQPAQQALATMLLQRESEVAGALELLTKTAPWQLNSVVFGRSTSAVATPQSLFFDPLYGSRTSLVDLDLRGGWCV